MKYTPYSYSKISTHQQCNRKFKYVYIDKVKPGKKDLTALLKGGAVHNIFENYPNPGTHKLAPKYQHIFDNFIKTKLGEKYVKTDSIREYSFGLTEDLQITTYAAKDALFRGFVDHICIIENVLHLIDWKTGKLKEQRWQSYDQLMFYAIYFFQKYSHVNTIRISYVYVEHNEAENDIVLERKYLQNYVNDLMSLIYAAENDIQFQKCPSKLCDYCEYKEHCDNDQ